MIINPTKLANLGLQGATLATRFLLIFFFAKYLDPASVGYYGIFTATIGYALYFVGLDFYTYVSREIIKTPANERGRLLKGQAALSGILYIILTAPGIWLISNSGWPDYLIWWFLPILLLEHINQELSRLLIVLSQQLTGSLILFIRQGSWAVITIALMTFNQSTRNLGVVMLLWSTAGLLAAGMGFWRLRKLQTSGWNLPVDWSWVKNGISVSVAFLIATLALRGIQTFDRYWLEALGGIETVGAYVLLLGVAGSLLTFLDAAVFSFAYPGLIQHYHRGEQMAARKKVTKLFIQTFAFSMTFALVSWFLLPHFLSWINNPIYQQALPMYPWLLSAMLINALSMVPHYALYARSADKPIIYSHLAALFIFIMTTWGFSSKDPSLAVPIGLVSAFAGLLLIKTLSYLELIQKEKNHQSTTAHT